jgi:hypothetical protein
MRRVAVACAVFAAGVVVGVAVLRPAHRNATGLEHRATRLVEAASGAKAVRVACVPDHCGVVVHRNGAVTCDGWVVPVDPTGALGRPRRTAFADC